MLSEKLLPESSEIIEVEPIDRIPDKAKQLYEVAKQMGIDEEINPEELAEVADRLNIKDTKRLVKIALYIKYRFTDKLSQYEAFKKSFPERCYYQAPSVKNQDGEVINGLKDLDELPKQTIIQKARRLESSNVYKHIFSILSTSLYIVYSFDRMRVIDLALHKIYDPDTKDRDRIEYMKVFLQETQKPEDLNININANVNNQQVNINIVEEKMENIAKKLNGLTAEQIMNLVGNNYDSK
jgi:hypothetical protein